MTEQRILAEPRGRKVLVTGARGFIGRAIAEALGRRGWEVHGVASSAVTAPFGGVVWHVADLLSTAEIEDVMAEISPSHMIHLGWAPNPGIYDSLENFRWVEASLGLLRHFAAAGGRRAVFAGSCAEYHWSETEALSEDAPLASATAYGAAKGALGRLFLDYCAFSSLSGAWARLFFLYGPREPRQRLVPAVITALLHGEAARCTHGEQIRDYLYVGDAAEALAALLESEVEGSINVASGRATRLKDMVMEVARQLGGEDLVELGALPADPEEPQRVVAAVGRLREELGWRPAHGLAEGLEETIAWWSRRLTH